MCTTAREGSSRSREALGGIHNIDVFQYRHRLLRPQQMEAALREEMISFLKALLARRTEEENVLQAAAETLSKIEQES